MRFYVKILFVLMLVLSACADPKPELKKRFFWPPLVDDPKIEYLGFYQTDSDVVKNNISKYEEIIFGREKSVLLFQSPFDVYSDGKGSLFVSEVNGRYVHVINYLTGEITRLKGERGQNVDFQSPMGIDGSRDGFIYVADSGSNAIFVFNSADHRLVRRITGDFLSGPVSLAVDEKRSKLYIVEPQQHKVLVLSMPEGEPIATWGGHGDTEGMFNFPIDIDLDADGNVYVLDSLNARVQVFDPEGEFLRSFGERGTALGSFSIPKGIAVSPSGYVYVTDSMAHRFVIFDLEGNFMMTVGGKSVSREGVSPGGFYLPSGIDVDLSDGVWVIDTLNRIVHRFQYLNDKYLEGNPVLPSQKAAPLQSEK